MAEMTEIIIVPIMVDITQQQQQDILDSLWTDTCRFGPPRAVRMTAFLWAATTDILDSSLALGCSVFLEFPLAAVGTVTASSGMMVVELGMAEGGADSVYGGGSERV